MFAEIFIRRPRLAMVIAVLITLAGSIALINIPVAQYPDITPPTIQVSASYPGADALTVAETVAGPIEEQVNGVEGMLYMSSTSSSSGVYTLTVTFAIGTDSDIAQVNVQNRVALATPQLPDAVTRLGVSVRAQQPNFLMIANVFSPQGTHDGLFLSNYAQINVVDPLSRVTGVGSASLMGALNYSMRIWLDPQRMAALSISTDDVTNAIQQQNVQAAAGLIGAPPIGEEQVLQYSITALGRLDSPDQFGNIIVRTNPDGGIVRVRDIGRVELGAQSYGSISQLNGKPAATVAIYQSPGSNALGVADGVRAQLEVLKSRFPADVEYQVIYDSTDFVRATIHEIVYTLVLTGIIVLLVVFVFLQDWRATLIPALTIPVSLIGVFAILLALGYSANTVTLFALILAIGLVVDDAIVVVENVQRVMEEEPGISPREATTVAMRQVTGPIVSTTLVLVAVFLPVAFLPGITGQLFRQFAVTITASVAISALNALTLSPALCAIMLRPPHAARGPFRWFNLGLDRTRDGYSRVT
ncbi:MAG: efflux RND transporter permease subunit, partial [Rhizobiaceae bacterium]|nr:efflux RND transporter permease subunit [Rhizobiaceae bacterium]